MVVYGGNYLHCCWPCFAHPPAIELGHGKSPIYAVAHFPLCSWDLLCCSSHTENQHNPKIWGWSMKRNHLGISSWFHRRYDTVPTPCWSILLLISSSPIARNSQKNNICWCLVELVDLVDPLSSNGSIMLPSHQTWQWNIRKILHVFRGVPSPAYGSPGAAGFLRCQEVQHLAVDPQDIITFSGKSMIFISLDISWSK